MIKPKKPRLFPYVAKPNVLAELVEKIKRGEFAPEPPLIYSVKSGGVLLKDGHHRLAAICHAEQPVTIQIQFDSGPIEL